VRSKQDRQRADGASGEVPPRKKNIFGLQPLLANWDLRQSRLDHSVSQKQAAILSLSSIVRLSLFIQARGVLLLAQNIAPSKRPWKYLKIS